LRSGSSSLEELRLRRIEVKGIMVGFIASRNMRDLTSLFLEIDVFVKRSAPQAKRSSSEALLE
jgi:hypothetical protein